MEDKYFITDEPNELVANLSTPAARLGKWGDWKTGYGKYTVALIVLYAVYNVCDTGFPAITIDNWFATIPVYLKYVLLFLVAFYVYRGAPSKAQNLLIINSKGILSNGEIFLWNELESFQLSLEKETKERYHYYYLHLQTKKEVDYKINISKYDKKLDEIHTALLNNVGNNEVKDLGFTQII